MEDNFTALVEKWLRSLTSALELDSWGQVIEAREAYTNLSRVFAREEHKTDDYSAEQRATLSKLKTCMALRSKALKSPMGEGLRLDEVKMCGPVLEIFLKGKVEKFPLDLSIYGPADPVKAGVIAEDEEDKGEAMGKRGGTLLPGPITEKGAKYLTITIQRIGIKNALQLMDPFITITALEKGGKIIDPPQNTPSSNKKSEQHIEYNCDVEIQTPLTKLPQDSAIFFEFKHYKPKKKKVSTRAWCFLEMDEIRGGDASLELYRKPTDPRRRKLRLLSVKNLYLHIRMSMTLAE